MTAPISNEPTTTRLHHYAGHYCSAVDIGGVGGWASGSAWYLAKLWDLPFSPFITNFARNSVVRQIDNGAKTAEFQRCEFKV